MDHACAADNLLRITESQLHFIVRNKYATRAGAVHGRMDSKLGRRVKRFSLRCADPHCGTTVAALARCSIASGSAIQKLL